jgi:ABC-type transport system involved in multi-copper enzyme maturation permease subunit
MAALRLAWRLQRWEILSVVALCLTLAAIAAWLTLDMRSVLARCGTPDATPACDVIFAFQETHGTAVGMVQSLIGFAPFIVGLVLGVPIVTREIEHRTALIAWPLAASRLRWLALRLLPPLLVGLLLVTVLAIAADQLARAYFPHTDLGFVQFEARGVPLVMRTALTFLAGVTIGAVVGRLLPALLLGIGLSVVVSVGLAFALPHWVPSTLLPDLEDDPAAAIGGRLHTAIQYRLPNGDVVSADEGEAFAETVYQAAGSEEPDPASLPVMIIEGVSGDRYGEVVVRESLALGVLAAVLAGTAAFVVERRRPE